VLGDEDFRARFEAARQACIAGHEHGCTYGGMSPSGGYWLAIGECPLDHGDVCAVCGGEPDSRFGDWDVGLLIWGVWLCSACTAREMALNPEKWRAPGESLPKGT
jgi:hypothetical protein